MDETPSPPLVLSAARLPLVLVSVARAVGLDAMVGLLMLLSCWFWG